MAQNQYTVPRVMPSSLNINTSRVVRIVGEVIQHKGDMVTLLTPEGNVTITQVSRIDNGLRFVEVEGVVNDDGSISEHAITNLGENFDLDTYYQAVRVSQRLPNVF
eukprot:CFRG8115T1